MKRALAAGCEAGQVAADQQGLNEQKRHCGHTRKPGCDIDWLSPGKERTGRGEADRNGKRQSERGPIKKRPGFDQAGVRTKSAASEVSRALCMTGRRKTVS